MMVLRGLGGGRYGKRCRGEREEGRGKERGKKGRDKGGEMRGRKEKGVKERGEEEMEMGRKKKPAVVRDMVGQEEVV